MQSDTKKGAAPVLTETDMVAGLTATSQRKCEPGVLVSRDHPFISGFAGASMAGGSCCTGTAGSAKKASKSGHLVASFLQPKSAFQIVLPRLSSQANECDRLSQNTCWGRQQQHLSPLHAPRRNQPVRRELALA